MSKNVVCNRKTQEGQENITKIVNEAFLKYWQELGLKSKARAVSKLAEKIGLDERTIQKCLEGKHVSNGTLRKLEKEFKLPDGILLYDINSRNDIRKEKERIRKCFLALKPFEAFTLASFFDVYIKISDAAFELLEYYTKVNEFSKRSIYKEILKCETTLNGEEILWNIKNVYGFQKLAHLPWTEHKQNFERLYYSSRYTNRKNKDDSIKKDLWNDILINKIEFLHLSELYKFSFQTDCIFTMDKRDWEIVVSFEMLSKKPLTELSDEQRKLLNFAKQLYESQNNENP